MKVVLTRPKYDTHLITPPLGLGYLSSYLKGRGFDVQLVDGLNRDLSVNEIVVQCQDADVVGIGCLSAYFLEVIELSKSLKKNNKVVIIGGPHASALPELTLRETSADYVVVGEGEVTLCELLTRLKDGYSAEGVQGVVTSQTKEIVKRDLVENIDNLPFADWDQMDPRGYKKAPHGALIKRFPVAPVISTRGCPFACKFCASPFLWERRIRYRSPEAVVDEIQWLVENFGVREIHFEDDNLTLNRAHIEEICSLLIEKGLDISWAAPNGIRVDTITPDLLRLMKESGCYYLAFGIESGNQAILDRVDKRTNLEVMEKAINESSKVGLMTQGFFIFGLPGETKETIKQTISFAKRCSLDRAQFLFLDILPGSQLWDELGYEDKVDWGIRSFQEISWFPETIDRKTLGHAQAKAFRSFFFRPRPLFSLIRYFRPSQLPFIIKRLLDFKIIPS